MAFAMALAGVFMVNRLFTFALLGLAVLALGLSLLVRLGKADFASAATTALLSAAFAFLPFLETFTAGYELYLITALQGLVLMITGIVARKPVQSLVALAIAATALTLDFFLRVDPVTKGINSDDFVICLLIVAFSAGLGAAIMRRNERALGLAAEASARDRERLERLAAALESSRGALGMGLAVRDSAQRIGDLVGSLRSSALEAKGRVDELAASSRSIAQAQSHIARASASVGESIADQSAVVAQSSSAMEEMTASVTNIASVTDSRRESIRRLKDRTEAGAGEMASAARAVRAMEESSSSILDFVAVIRAVASRTNLLAMNAAIEAAHAGEAGRGFAVVADEIRKLSEATGQNVKLIASSAKGTVDSIKAVAETNGRAQSIFGEIDADVDGVAGALEEVARGLGEITAGTDELLAGSSRSVGIAASVREAAASADERIRAASRDIEVLGEVAQDVQARLSAIASALDELLAEAGSVGEAGKANEEGQRRLYETLARVG